MTTTTTNGAASATVETLTAEVRALMIGNRQVTLSVYRQLDRVPYDEIEPFGRVRDNQDNVSPHVDRVYVVGKHMTTGALVRSLIWVRVDSHVMDAPAVRMHWAYHHTGNPGWDWHAGMASRGSTIGATILRRLPVIWRRPDRVDLSEFCDAPTFDEPAPEDNGVVTPAWDEWSRAQGAHSASRRRGDFCDLDALGIQVEFRQHDDVIAARASEEQLQAAAALPLIVLAGLR